jgi:hypothetical protein
LWLDPVIARVAEDPRTMSQDEPSRPSSESAGGLMTRIERVGLWLVAQSGLVGAIAWIAFQLQQESIAPAVLFPLVVGGILGALTAIIVRAVGWPGLRVAVLGALVAGLLVVIAQDYIGHRHRVRQLADQISRQDPLAQAIAGSDFARPQFTSYLAGKFRAQPAWWTLDLLLTSVAAAATTAAILVKHRQVDRLEGQHRD